MRVSGHHSCRAPRAGCVAAGRRRVRVSNARHAAAQQRCWKTYQYPPPPPFPTYICDHPFLRVRATATTRAGRPPSNRVNRAPSYHFVQPPPTTQARWTCPVAPRRRACHRHASPLRNASTPRRPTPRASGRRPPCATAWRPASPSNSPRADDRPIAVVRKTSRVRSSPRGPATTAGGLSRCTSSVQQTRAQRVT